MPAPTTPKKPVLFIVTYTSTTWVRDEYTKDGTRYQVDQAEYAYVYSEDDLAKYINKLDVRFFEVFREVHPKVITTVSVSLDS